MKKSVFEFIVVWQPSEKKAKEGDEPKIIVDLQRVLASGPEQAGIIAARKIPEEYLTCLEEVQVIVRPFT